jgi:hypothetical protein
MHRIGLISDTHGLLQPGAIAAPAFQKEYNDFRPQNAIDYRSPSEYRAKLLNQVPLACARVWL